MLEGQVLGYAGACYAAGTGDYDWFIPQAQRCLRNKYASLDDITYLGIVQGAAEVGVEKAKSSSKQCEPMLDILAAFYKKCGLNPQKVYIAKKGFLKKRKEVYGY